MNRFIILNSRRRIELPKAKSWKFYFFFAISVHVLLVCVLLMRMAPPKQQAVSLIHAVVVPLPQVVSPKTPIHEVQQVKPQPVAIAEESAPQVKESLKELESPEPLAPAPSLTMPQRPLPAPKQQKVAVEKKPKQVQKAEKVNKPTPLSEQQIKKIAPSPKIEETLVVPRTEQAAPAAPAVDQKEIDRYRAMIAKTISRYWVVPANLDKNLTTILLLRLAPDGSVLEARIVQPSGEALLDRSALAAVHKASPLPVPEDSVLFDQFRELRVKVRPEGIIYET